MPSKFPHTEQQQPDRATAAIPSLLEQAHDQRERWQAALAKCCVRHMDVAPDAMARPIADAGRRAVERIARAMLQEGLIRVEAPVAGQSRVVPAQATAQPAVHVLHGLTPSTSSLFPRLQLSRQGADQGLTPIEDPVELLELVARGADQAPPGDLLRLAEELTDAVLNDALCSAYRAGWNTRLRDAARRAGKSTFWQWLKDRSEPANEPLMLEQWSAVGHPYHPTHKAKLGMTPAEVVAFSPEFEPEVQVGLVAARRELTRSETLPGAPTGDRWLEHHFPACAEAWRDALVQQGGDPDAYVAIPVHPWQAAHEIPKRFGRSIANGDLIPLAAPTIPSKPTTSVRTLVPTASSVSPHIKLSLGVRLTSVPRTISPRSCEMGPRIGKLLKDAIAGDGTLSSAIDIVPEELGLYYLSTDPDESGHAEHLAAVLRANPVRTCDADESLVPTTALTARSPMTDAPLFLEISRAAGEASTGTTQARFRHYAETLLRPLLTLYLRYGIGLEAHQQNTFAVYTRSGTLKRFLFRDFGGIRIHEPTLRDAGLSLTVHPDRLTVVDERAAVRKKLITSGLHYHLGFLISRICRHLRVSERPFWSDVADVVETTMNDLRGDLDASTWRQERTAFLDADWEFKASLRMRLENLLRDVYVQGTNPLRRTGQRRPEQ